MSDQNGDGPHKTATVVPPLGHDGSDLIAFFSAVMRGDQEFPGERRRIALRDTSTYVDVSPGLVDEVVHRAKAFISREFATG